MKSAAVKWAAGIFMESTAKSSPLSGGAEVAQLKCEERSRATDTRTRRSNFADVWGPPGPVWARVAELWIWGRSRKAESFQTLHRYEANDTDACPLIRRAGAAVSHPLHLPFNLALLCFPCLSYNPLNNQMFISCIQQVRWQESGGWGGLCLSIIEMFLPSWLRFPYPALSLPEAWRRLQPQGCRWCGISWTGDGEGLFQLTEEHWCTGARAARAPSVIRGHLLTLPRHGGGSGQGFLRPEPDQSKQLWKCHKESQSAPFACPAWKLLEVAKSARRMSQRGD